MGLTGSIGSGKTTTANFFRDLGIPVWDADAVVTKLYGPGGAAVAPVSARFPQVLQDGALDKEKMRALIAENPGSLDEISRIVHPMVQKDREQFIAERTVEALLVFDIPLLFETNADAEMDAVLVVTIDEDTRKKRVLDRGTMDETAYKAMLARQMPDAEKRVRADYVIETREIAQTHADISALVEKLREGS